jgi:hypothetical protein
MPTARPAAHAPTATATASVAARAADATTRAVVVTRRPLPDLDEPAGAASCTLEGSFRGTVGDTTRVSVVLWRAGGGMVLKGVTHYDLPGPGLTSTGVARGRGFTLSEAGGATFVGACDVSGALRGEATLGKKRLPFVLWPRPAGEPGLYRVTRKAEGELRAPGCAAVASRTAITSVLDAEGRELPCAPTDPAHKKAALEERPDLRCRVSHATLQVFGLGDAALERKVNAALSGLSFAGDEQRAKACTGPFFSERSQRLVWASAELLVVSPFESRFTGGPRPMSHRGSALTIDLRAGRAVAVTDLLELSALAPAAARCLAVARLADDSGERFSLPLEPPSAPACGSDGGDRGYLWGCAGAPDEPTWTPLREGLVLGAWGVPNVAADEGGRGPVLAWGVLLRDRALLSSSPLAHLWAGVARAQGDALACAGTYRGDHVRAWR